MVFDYIVSNNSFIGLGITSGDILLFDMDTKPKHGDITLFEYNGKRQAVWYLGNDYLDHPIVATNYIVYPKAISHWKLPLAGKMITTIKGDSGMTKNERIHLISITAQLETVIEGLYKAISPVDSKERVYIICEQIKAIRGVVGDIVKGGAVNG